MESSGGQWFPAWWPDRIRAHVRGELTPVAPRPAATVLLLRDRPVGAAVGIGAGVEVYLLRRRASMAFAAAWARWITPEFEERRYDTWFVAAALPPGQLSGNVSTEADHAAWVRPEDALAAYERGESLMLPPTVATLREVARHRSVAEALAVAAGRTTEPVMARVRQMGREIVLSRPGHEEFERRVTVAAPPGRDVKASAERERET